MKPMDQICIRRQNVTRIWDLMSRNPRMTRQKLAEASGLSLMTVTNLIDCLNRYHVLDFQPMVQPQMPGRRNAGRHADLISLNTTRHAWVILDLTDVHFRYCALSLDLATLPSSFVFPYDPLRDYNLNLKDFLRRVRGVMEQEQKTREILGVAVVVPGPYDVTQDRVNNKRVEALNRINIKALLRQETGLYDYYVDEDVKFSVRAFSDLATQHECEVLYYLYMGEGVGGAVLHNGKVMRGLNAVAGDAAQMLTPDGTSYEANLSLRTFARNCGIDPKPSDSWEDLQAAINRCALSDFSRYQAAMLKSAELVGSMLHSVSCLLDPSQVVIDCPYITLYQDQFMAHIRARLSTLLGSELAVPQMIPSPYALRCVILGATQVLSHQWIERVI